MRSPYSIRTGVALANLNTANFRTYDDASNEIERKNVYNGVQQKTPRDALNRISRRDVLDGTTSLSYEIYVRNPMEKVKGSVLTIDTIQTLTR